MPLTEAAAAIAADLDGDRPHDAIGRIGDVLETGALRQLLHAELRALLTGATPPTKNAPADQLRIVSSAGVDMRARAIAGNREPAGPIRTLTRTTLIANPGRAAFAVRRWHQAEPEPNDVFDARKVIEPLGDTVLEPGESLVANAAYDAYELVGTAGPAVALTVAGSHRVPLAWLYHRSTRGAVGVDPAGREWLFIRELISFTDAVGDASLAPAMRALAAHPSHFIRWAAAQSLLRLAPDAGHGALRELANDVHPQIRFAARHRLGSTVPA